MGSGPMLVNTGEEKMVLQFVHSEVTVTFVSQSHFVTAAFDGSNTWKVT